MRLICIFFASILLLNFMACRTLLKSKVEFTDASLGTFRDSAWMAYKGMVTHHYDSINGLKQKMNDVFTDPFVEDHIKIIALDVDTLSGRVIDLGYVVGEADSSDYEWLIYKIKKQALLKGGNLVASFKTYYYNDYTIWYWLKSAASGNVIPEGNLRRVKCSGKAIFLKEMTM